MRKIITLLSFAAVLWAGLAVVYIRFEVNSLSDELADMAAAIEADKRSIHVLKAELAYLTSPSHLQEMSLQYLALMPPQADQVLTRIEDIPFKSGQQTHGDKSGKNRQAIHLQEKRPSAAGRRVRQSRQTEGSVVHTAFTAAAKGEVQQVTIISSGNSLVHRTSAKGMGHD